MSSDRFARLPLESGMIDDDGTGARTGDRLTGERGDEHRTRAAVRLKFSSEETCVRTQDLILVWLFWVCGEFASSLSMTDAAFHNCGITCADNGPIPYKSRRHVLAAILYISRTSWP